MTAGVVATVALTVLVAGFAQGTTGLGFAMICAPIVGMAAPDLLPVFLLVLMIPLNIYIATRERHALDRGGTGWITAGRVVGTFGGLAVLATMPVGALHYLIGGATVLAALVTLRAPAFAPGSKAFVGAGAVTGVMETATGIGGPPLALVLQHRPAPVLRSTVATCFVIGEIVSLAVLFATGEAHLAQLTTALWFAPALAAGALLSRWVHHRVDGARMRAIVLVFAIASGLLLIVTG